jgi:hypothetical protein
LEKCGIFAGLAGTDGDLVSLGPVVSILSIATQKPVIALLPLLLFISTIAVLPAHSGLRRDQTYPLQWLATSLAASPPFVRYVKLLSLRKDECFGFCGDA